MNWEEVATRGAFLDRSSYSIGTWEKELTFFLSKLNIDLFKSNRRTRVLPSIRYSTNAYKTRENYCIQLVNRIVVRTRVGTVVAMVSGSKQGTAGVTGSTSP